MLLLSPQLMILMLEMKYPMFLLIHFLMAQKLLLLILQLQLLVLMTLLLLLMILTVLAKMKELLKQQSKTTYLMMTPILMIVPV